MANICPKCNKSLGNKKSCEQCNITPNAYKKIIDTSKIFYNEGLQKAQSRDLTGAIELLVRSVKLNKQNIDARNLLGLVYFEIGETVLAFQQWVVSKSLQPDQNIANDYLKRAQENQSNLDRLSTAIKKYNQALAYIKQGSIDLAMIQLKKIILTNNNFVKAYCLLALVYIKEGEIDKARKELFRALEVDKGNYLVHYYLTSLGVESNEKVIIDPKEEVRMERRKLKRQIVINQSVQQFMGVLFGLALGVAILYLLVMPNQMDKKNVIIDAANSELKLATESIDTLTSEKIEHEQTIKNLQLDLKNAVSENTELSSKDAKVQKLMLAMTTYLDGNIVESAEYLQSVDISDSLDGVLNNLYQQLTKVIYVEAALKTYTEGKTAYDRVNYALAIEKFELCIKYVSTENFADDAHYFLGRSYQFTDKPDQALEMFRYLVSTYPDSNQINNANKQIKFLSGN
jgi:tetratricopeptide (TPR) repeat protein